AKAEQNAIKILNAWSDVESFTPDSADKLGHHRLVGGINLGYIACMADLLMSMPTSWPRAEQEKFKFTWRNVILPIISRNRPFFFNGNWDLACAWSILASAVMLDDRTMFDAEINRLRQGKTNACFSIYLMPSGQCQETGRDVLHSQMGLFFASLCAQVAWNQGIDLFEGPDYSLGRCFEYLALYQLGEDRVPYRICHEAVGHAAKHPRPAPSPICRGRFLAIYELVYHHYQMSYGIELPNVKRVLETQTRPETPGPNVNMFSTLCFWNLKSANDPVMVKKVDVRVSLISTGELQERNRRLALYVRAQAERGSIRVAK
ncbi:MAG: hypothetical protein D6820_07230, partial [Lentisphaerae bacterium]